MGRRHSNTLSTHCVCSDVLMNTRIQHRHVHHARRTCAESHMESSYIIQFFSCRQVGSYACRSSEFMLSSCSSFGGAVSCSILLRGPSSSFFAVSVVTWFVSVVLSSSTAAKLCGVSSTRPWTMRWAARMWRLWCSWTMSRSRGKRGRERQWV